MSGLCECGCGEKTRVAKNTNTKAGHIAGQPMRFVHGHAARVRQHPPIEARLRAKSRVAAADDLSPAGFSGCWLWTSPPRAGGYAHVKYGKAMRPAHVVAWELIHGPVPDGLELDHLCRRRHCINPAHLEAVTHAVNTRRGDAAKLTEGQVAEIRQMRRHGLSLRALAKQFSVSKSCVHSVVSGETWKGVES